MSWRAEQERSNLRIVRMARRLTQILPRRVGRWLLVPTSMYFLAANRSARNASCQFFDRVLTNRPGLLTRWGMFPYGRTFRHFMTFATVVMDRAYLIRGNLNSYDIEVVGEELVEAVRRAGKGGFLVGAHVGSFEALRALGRENREHPRIVMVMYEDNARMISEALATLNPALKEDIIALGRTDSMIRVKQALDAGAVVGILADRLLDSESDAADRRTAPFLGCPAPFPLGPFRMAALLRRQVLLMFGIYLGGNRYRLVFETLYDFSTATGDRRDAIAEAQQRYVERLEHYTRAYPFNWFNFFDFWAGADRASPVSHGDSKA